MSADKNPNEKPDSIMKKFRRDFLYGLFIVLPSIATIALVVFFINTISGPVKALFGQTIPTSLSLIITVVFITLIGVAGRNIIGKAILNVIEDLMSKIPLINTIYKSTKQILHAFSLQKKGLQSAVLIEYPRKGIHALAFITKENPTGLIDKKGKDFSEGKVSVFVPTTPNPTSGYFIYIDKKEIIYLDISIEESVKVLMSAGVVSPEPKAIV
jgi:uncharacterized membrane protein